MVFVPSDRALQPEGLLHSRGVAASDFRPLRKIPHCCLPQESGPCFSSSVADHPLRPATDLSLGEPLPHQLANQTRAHLKAKALASSLSQLHLYSALELSSISQPFGRLFQTLRQITHVLLTRTPLYSVLLHFTFDLHVLSTPPAFALSQDQTLMFFINIVFVSGLPLSLSFNREPIPNLAFTYCFYPKLTSRLNQA